MAPSTHGSTASHSTLPPAEKKTSSDKEKSEQQPRQVTRDGSGSGSEKREPTIVNGKRVLTDDDEGVKEKTAMGFPTWKKWWIITVIFWIQLSMNFNTGVYANGVKGIAAEFGLSEQGARVGQAVFLVAYAFGSQLWAPWSEELGRRNIMQMSLFLVNIWQLPCALAPNYASIVVARVLGGLSSAGGSVTIGMVADMWEPEDQLAAIAYVVFSSVGGSSIGPIIGPFAEAYLSWQWIFWLQLIFGGAVQLLHFFTVPETRSAVLIDREAKRRREEEGQDVWGPNEVKEQRFTLRKCLIIWYRPFQMLVTEPIVLCCSLLSGFSDALIFIFIESFALVYEQWGFEAPLTATTFVPIWIGYLICWASMVFPYLRTRAKKRKDPNSVTPEDRLWFLLFTGPLEPVGLFGYAWTSFGPSHTPWIAPMIFSCLVAIANYAIYLCTIDYMVASYGPYSSSATGSNAFARNFLAGVSTMYSVPLYTNLGYQWASTLLGFLGVGVIFPIFIFYFKGEMIRKKSKFASEIAEQRASRGGHRVVEEDKYIEKTHEA